MMRYILLILTTAIFLGCAQLPVKSLPNGAVVQAYILHNVQNKITTISMANNETEPVDIGGLPKQVFFVAPGWRIRTVPEVDLVANSSVLLSWIDKYSMTSRWLFRGARATEFDLLLVPKGWTFRFESSSSLKKTLKLSFVFPVSSDKPLEQVFQKLLTSLAHEQYHIYKRLDVGNSASDAISREAFANFVGICFSNEIFGNFILPGTGNPHIKRYIEEGYDIEVLREDMDVNLATKDLLQNSMAGQLVVRYLLETVMQRPGKDVDLFQTELGNLCRHFSMTSLVSWEQLYQLYSDTVRG